MKKHALPFQACQVLYSAEEMDTFHPNADSLSPRPFSGPLCPVSSKCHTDQPQGCPPNSWICHCSSDSALQPPQFCLYWRPALCSGFDTRKTQSTLLPCWVPQEMSLPEIRLVRDMARSLARERHFYSLDRESKEETRETRARGDGLTGNCKWPPSPSCLQPQEDKTVCTYFPGAQGNPDSTTKDY